MKIKIFETTTQLSFILIFRGVSSIQKPRRSGTWRPVISSSERLSHQILSNVAVQDYPKDGFPNKKYHIHALPTENSAMKSRKATKNIKGGTLKGNTWSTPASSGQHLHHPGQHLHHPPRPKFMYLHAQMALEQRSHKDRRTQYLGERQSFFFEKLIHKPENEGLHKRGIPGLRFS